MKSRFPFRFTVLVFSLLFASAMAFAEKSTITIESAQKSEYKKDQNSGDDIIVLTGSVSVSVASGNTKTTITANQITFNRATEMIYASGGVHLLSSGGSEGSQNISAETLLFNASTMEGVFDNGRAVQTQSDAINLPSGSTLVVSSDIFGRDSSGTIAFKNGELTFCDDENPHWKIRAGRIWLLPGGEFAFVNAVLWIGNIPIFYFPAFYYPKDELIFNPVVGFSKRSGYYVQTTTYLVGRKPLEKSSSGEDDDITAGLYNFMKPTKLKKQVREGLVLHNLDEDWSADSSDYLKFIADYYTNLGVLVGIDGVYKPQKYISNIEGNLKLGFSNTLFGSSGEGYRPYSSSGEKYQDKSNFMGLELPFRYGASLKLAMNKPFTFNLSLPIWSDPFFSYDFGKRNESMDWIGFITSATGDDDDDNVTEVSTFTWTASGSYTIPLPDIVKPYVNSLGISSASSSVIFSSKNNGSIYGKTGDDWASYTPERRFYYPSQVTPFKISTRIAGTIFEYPKKEKSVKTETPQLPVPLVLPEEFDLNPKKDVEKSGSAENDMSKEKSGSAMADSAAKKDEEPVLPPDALPVISGNTPQIKNLSNLNYSLTYSIAPEYVSQINYDAAILEKPEDFDWKKIQSTYYQVKAPVTLSSDLSYGGSFASMKNSFTFNPVFQEHPNLDGYVDSSKESVQKTDYNARKLDLTNTNSVSLKPFGFGGIFRDSGFSWNTTVKMVRTNFLGDMENPEWEYLTADWDDEESITNHTLSGTISAVENKDFSQVLTLSTNLPPQVDEYTATLSLKFPYTTASFSGGFKKSGNEDDAQWIKKPFQQSLTFRFLDSKLNFTESLNYNYENKTLASPEKDHFDSIKFSLSYQQLQLAFTAQYTYDYQFVPGTGWKLPEDNQKKFIPATASLAWTAPSKSFSWQNGKVSFTPGLSTSLVVDCDRVTNSYFRFVPSVTFKIKDHLDLTFSSESQNSVVYRYVQDWFDSDIQLPGETNIFKDLINSFAFWGDGKFIDSSQTLRKNSGFKLKNLNVKITHSLCDWDLAASFSISPRLLTENGTRKYDFSPYFTLSVLWKPMGAIKTSIVDDYGEWRLE